MKYKAVLFDLDGTLLPMDNDEFTRAYFDSLALNMQKNGYEPQEFIKAVWSGVKKTLVNDGSDINENVFWNEFIRIFGQSTVEHKPLFEEYYKNEYQSLKSICNKNNKVKNIVKQLKIKGVKLVVATNPLFPKTAIESRIRWAGLEPSDFIHITTYDKSSYCKPNPLYYKEIVEKINLEPRECVMVGNDVLDDMSAESIGIKVFLLTNYLINKSSADLSSYEKGGLEELCQFLEI